MKLALAATLLVLASGCASTNDGTSTDDNAPAKPDPGVASTALVQQRYGDCLKKLHATLDQGLEFYVSYDVRGGGLLTFHVTKLNGKTYTVPSEDKDTALLETVGC